MANALNICFASSLWQFQSTTIHQSQDAGQNDHQKWPNLTETQTLVKCT